MTTEKKKKKRLNRKLVRGFFTLLLCVSLCTACYSGWKLYTGMKEYKESQNVYANILQEAVAEEADEPASTAAAEQTADSSLRTVDWDYLSSINENIAGWITLEDSTIDYPFVYADDNDYYLTHLIDGEYNRAGTVFVDARNSRGFTDQNTVLYAHHMRNGSMFADVENYKDPSYYETHTSFTIQTPDAVYDLYPVAGVLTTGDIDYVQFTFADDEEFLNYVSWFTEQSTFTSAASIEAGDQTVMLSTCSYDVTNGRYVLLLKLVKRA